MLPVRPSYHAGLAAYLCQPVGHLSLSSDGAPVLSIALEYRGKVDARACGSGSHFAIIWQY